MKKNKFDIIIIGLGPAGMALTAMSTAMGKKVCVIEQDKLGGECLNVGCIPSKGLLAHARKMNYANSFYNPFEQIAEDIALVRDGKTAKMFEKATIIKAKAEFISYNLIKADNELYTARKIFIATGTKPFIPAIEGINDIEFLTNETIFNLKQTPKSMIIVGGGAIGCEMAQAFANMGTKITLIHNEKHLLPHTLKQAGLALEKSLQEKGVKIINQQYLTKVEKSTKLITATTTNNQQIKAEQILIATGRKFVNQSLNLEKANIILGSRGEIKTNKYLQTSNKNIYAVGDCNGKVLLSHAAMHQGMIALMNSMSFIKQSFDRFPIPWTVFTDLQVSYVGLTEKQLKAQKIKYQTTTVNYEDYGAAIAEHETTGFVKVMHSLSGKIYAVSIVGKNSGEMINQWTLAIQNNLRLHNILFMAHSFPTMGFLNKRIAETWMMNLLKYRLVKILLKLFK